MTAFDNKESKNRGIIIIMVVVVVIALVALLIGGVNGLFGIIKAFMSLAMLAAFIGMIVYLVYYLFIKKHRRDIPHENWKSYVRSGVENGADMMNDLILTGDKNHNSKNFMTIKGYLRILGFDGNEYDMFIGKKSSINPFEEYKVVLLRPEQHSDLIGDVYCKGISLIQKYGYYFLNTDMLDFNAIDKTVANDTYRSLLYETLGDMKGLLDRATGLDPEFRKEQLQQKILKIPVMSGQQQPGK